MKNKILKSLIVLFVILIFVFNCIACSNNEEKDEFILVQSITYTVNGETRTRESRFGLVGNSEEITREEYLKSPESQRISSNPDLYTILPSDYKMPRAHEGKIAETDTSDLTKYFIVYNFGYRYYKGVYDKKSYLYIYVKLIDKDMIVIKYSFAGKDKEETLLVTSLKISHFENYNG